MPHVCWRRSGDQNDNLGNNECFYFYTNSIESTQYKGSNEDYEQYYIFGKPSYVENCSGSTADSGNSSTAPATQISATIDTTETPWMAIPTATHAPTEKTQEFTSNESNVADEASDIPNESIGDAYPVGTVAPGGCRGKKRSWTRG
ncbi:hypothetical protein PI124_g23009 [Phytophthora idaei]|nr:hypothetical protein PI125_g24998 [Phytophthora idaei]KAG3125024.1 hypothetical protein PI126_g22959 [Phytophthora idaei]KAG3231896.1 hypothetical protein PI124_g23009 [Phytophthora idaei]